VCSIVMGSKPRFGLVNLAPGQILAAWGPFTSLDLRYKTKLYNLTGLEYLSDETVDIYRILRQLVAEIDRPHRFSGEGMTKAEFQEYSHQLMRRVVDLIQYKPEPSNPNALIYGLFGNAAMVHVTSYVSEPTRRGSIVELLATRIRESLEVIHLPTFQIAYPEMMLWIMMVGGIAAIGTESQSFFTELFGTSCSAAGINKVTEELPYFLTEFLWSDTYFNPFVKGFWDEVAQAQANAVEAGRLAVV
jgi:hypothetical protein